VGSMALPAFCAWGYAKTNLSLSWSIQVFLTGTTWRG